MSDVLDQLIIQVTTLKGPSAIVVFIIMLGYAAKMIPNFPNKFIPLVSFAVGPVLTPILVGWPSPGSMAPDVRFPELAAWATSVMTGFLLACIAWVSHAQVLRRLIDDKIPALNPDRTTDSVKETVVHSDGDKEVKTFSNIEKTTDQTKP